MAIVYTDSQNYSDIADAIRAKNGTATTYAPADMATAISNLPSGGGNSDVLIPAELPFPKATEIIT